MFGLGYVGIVSAACLARDGHRVVGVDPQPQKVDLVNAGQPPIIETYVGELVSEAVTAGTLRATGSAAEAVAETEMSLVCVGTPSRRNGSLDTGAVARVCEEIGAAIAAKGAPHLVVIRSTVLPGTMRELVIPTLERSAGMPAGPTLRIANNPEFLRESSAVYDYDNPPKTVVGSDDPEVAAEVLALYETLPGPKIATRPEVAEMVKYADNSWHAVKVAFANEIGNIAKAVGVDSWEVMDIFCQDLKLNISPYYLRPGFAFGGSCLPKDVRALTYKARSMDLNTPILNAIMPSNQVQIDKGMSMITEKGSRKIGVLGFSFKAGTDDLRESPLVEVIERLIGKGYDVRLYDRNVRIASLVGANKDYILNKIPHISKLMVDSIDEVLGHAQTIVIGNGSEEFRDVAERLSEGQVIVDFVKLGARRSDNSTYDGICW